MLKRKKRLATIGGSSGETFWVEGGGRAGGREWDSTWSKGGIKGNMGIISRENGLKEGTGKITRVCVRISGTFWPKGKFYNRR